MGLYDADGKVELFGQELNFKDTKSVLQAGVAMVSEDRKGVGLLLDRSIEDNIVFNAMQIERGVFEEIWPIYPDRQQKIRETAQAYIKIWISAVLDQPSIQVHYPAATSRRFVLQRRCACPLNSFLFLNLPVVLTLVQKSWC